MVTQLKLKLLKKKEQFSESVDGEALFGLISASEEMSEMFSLVTKAEVRGLNPKGPKDPIFR